MTKIIWSEKAKDDFWKNIEYLEFEWSEKEAIKFIEKVEKLVSKLEKRNIDFVITDYKNVYKVPITKHITLFYRSNDETVIELLRFWNNFQSPEKFKI